MAMAAALSSAAAQTSASPVAGVVFDSLHHRPLGNAFVTLTGVSGGATTDEKGRFQFDSVTPGSHTVSVQHELLDSIGLTGLSRKIQTGDGAPLHIAVPSFQTLWSRFCGGEAPEDTAVVFGRVTDADGQFGLRSASVEVMSVDLVLDKTKKVQQHGRLARVRADTTGWYALCGVPASTDLQIRAAGGADTSGAIDILPGDLRIRRRDIRVGHEAAGGGSSRGVVAGSITAAGVPRADVKLVIEGTEVRSGVDGKFVIPNVKTGTRQLEITSIGMKPAIVTVDVAAHDTAFVAYDLQKVVALSPVQVFAPEARRMLVRDFEFRKKEGLGTYLDSDVVGKHATFSSALSELPFLDVHWSGAHFSVTVFKASGQGSTCPPALLIDGISRPVDLLQDLTPNQIAAVEFYRSSLIMPADLAARVKDGCGLLAVWTKHAFP